MKLPPAPVPNTRIFFGLGRLWKCCWPALLWMVGPVYGQQSALQPASAQSEGIALLWWAMFYGGTAIFVAVMALLGLGLWQARQGGRGRLSSLASRNLVLAAGVAIPLAVLIVLVGGSLFLGRSIASQPPDDALTVRVVGWQWWWQIEYLNHDGELVATTANELHVPVGRPVELLLTSGDVIHSFWVPELQGKTDLVPGTTNTSWFTADRPGTFRGQCAEFCGVQHALMAFLVIVEPEKEFRQWLDNQAVPAASPTTERETRGRQAFLNSGCGECHSIRGTAADGDTAPDLTHLASRQTLAGVTVPNTRGHLAGWVSDPQSLKPGSLMPRTMLGPGELTDLLAYLESLE